MKTKMFIAGFVAVASLSAFTLTNNSSKSKSTYIKAGYYQWQTCTTTNGATGKKCVSGSANNCVWSSANVFCEAK